jgi:hypothetical protein
MFPGPYRRNACTGDKSSQFALGSMYLYGEGTTADGLKAYAWLASAAEAREPQYRNALENLEKAIPAEHCAMRAEAGTKISKLECKPPIDPRTGYVEVSIDRTKAHLTEQPFSALPHVRPLPPGTTRTTPESTDFLPEWTAGPERGSRPQTPANRPRRSRRPDATQAPIAAAWLDVCATANGGARPAGSRDSASAARIAPIASGGEEMG